MNSIQTLYGQLTPALFQMFKQIRLLVCDVDGIFSDGRIYLGNGGEEYKAFHTRDGYGVKALLKNHIQVAVITGRKSRIVEDRMRALGLTHIVQGTEHKRDAMQCLMDELNLASHQVAAMGDDMPDKGMFELAALKICVPDGHPYMQQKADYITQCPGGFGAVREVCDQILHAHHLLEAVHGSSV
ncbi:3-deoxy-manno-octulosonate-8-phosphatase KdsC [Bowmanella dokdonensis]|uniref:3-deoxy-D-manno-octulosonate 8-phosphate phosphatase KdsC n=1 Tax=Bowmanella dokdonensis TaxID=751969 RepID=A0A939IPY7_9ALTE|nr:3-deoxy-manno-octulosonate-8-phosphatase KdsC [Bowmanella dokdonensis]MBN7824057.1 3-deoxy-manno-octulosonate-8-phosphatase KdsC [Bowmanella dokdonensis]